MNDKAGDDSRAMNQLIGRRKYTDLKDYVLKHFPMSDPFDILHKTGISYIDAFTSRYVSTLEDGIVERFEELGLRPEDIIALRPATGEVLRAVLRKLEDTPQELNSPGFINMMAMELQETTEDDILFSFEKYDLTHMGKKAYEYHRINMKGRNLLFNIASYVLGPRKFKSGRQRKYFVDTLTQIHRSRVLEEPCRSEDEACKRCHSCNQKLENLLGPVENLEEDG